MRTVCDSLYTIRRATDSVALLCWHQVIGEEEAGGILRRATSQGRVTVGRHPDGIEDEARCVIATDGGLIREHRLIFREAV